MRCLHHCCTVKTNKNPSEATLGCLVPRPRARRRAAVDKVMGGVIDSCALPFCHSPVRLFCCSKLSSFLSERLFAVVLDTGPGVSQQSAVQITVL